MTRRQGWPPEGPEEPNPTAGQGKVGFEGRLKDGNYSADDTAQGERAATAMRRLLLERLAYFGLTCSTGQDDSLIVGGKQLDARTASVMARQLGRCA